MTTFIVSVWIILCGDASIFNSITTFEFFNQDISCNSNEPCTIICDEPSSCLNSYIYCPANYSCDITCGAPSACNDATIQWPSNNDLGHISCMEGGQTPACFAVNYPIPSSTENFTLNCIERKCEGALIYCPEHSDCTVNCIGEASCAATQIIWSITGINTLTCNGFQSCESVNFPNKTTDDSHFHFICQMEISCESATIYCPLNKDCHIECRDPFACENTIIHWSPNPNVNSDLTCNSATSCLGASSPPVFATNNNENFYFNCTSNLECYYGTIYCPINAECHIRCEAGPSCVDVSINWPANHAYSLTCEATSSECIDIVHNPTLVPTYNPSITPSNIPSKSPSKTPSKFPTISPTNNPSYTPSKYPTNTPSKYPTTSPSYNPTISPTNNPSNYPSITPTNNPSHNPSITPTYNPSKTTTQLPTQIPIITTENVKTNTNNNNANTNANTNSATARTASSSGRNVSVIVISVIVGMLCLMLGIGSLILLKIQRFTDKDGNQSNTALSINMHTGQQITNNKPIELQLPRQNTISSFQSLPKEKTVQENTETVSDAMYRNIQTHGFERENTKTMSDAMYQNEQTHGFEQTITDYQNEGVIVHPNNDTANYQ